MASFRSTLEDCRLCDLGFSGPKFTWSNCRGVGQHTEERLNRATATQEWCVRFPDAALSVLAARCSDHITPCWSVFREHTDILVGDNSNSKLAGTRMLNVWRLSKKHGPDSVSVIVVHCRRCKGNYKSVSWPCQVGTQLSIATLSKLFPKRPSSLVSYKVWQIQVAESRLNNSKTRLANCSRWRIFGGNKEQNVTSTGKGIVIPNFFILGLTICRRLTTLSQSLTRWGIGGQNLKMWTGRSLSISRICSLLLHPLA